MKSLSMLVAGWLLAASVAPAAIILNGNGQLIEFTATPAGSGNIDAFLRIQANGTQSGYNTDGALEFDTKGGGFTTSLLLTAVPLINVGGTMYREFVLDINENDADIVLEELEIYLTGNPNLTNYNFGANATMIYQLSNGPHTLLDVNAGSGQGDYRLLLPDSLFVGGTNVVLFSSFSGSSGGFEEWAVSLNAGGAVVPEPSTFALLGSVLIGAGLLRRRKAQ